MPLVKVTPHSHVHRESQVGISFTETTQTGKVACNSEHQNTVPIEGELEEAAQTAPTATHLHLVLTSYGHAWALAKGNSSSMTDSHTLISQSSRTEALSL